jgi:hypothetical protein
MQNEYKIMWLRMKKLSTSSIWFVTLSGILVYSECYSPKWTLVSVLKLLIIYKFSMTPWIGNQSITSLLSTQDNTNRMETLVCVSSGIRTLDPSVWEGEDSSRLISVNQPLWWAHRYTTLPKMYSNLWDMQSKQSRRAYSC